MAKVGAQRAAELTGRSKSTIQRAMNSGKISFEVDNNNRRVIDVAELDRAFGLMPQETPQRTSGAAVEAELEKASQLLEMERLKMRIRLLEEQVDMAQTTISDIKDQRDQWQKQAQQVLLTSQYSQKQAEDLKEEIKERERRARLRRQQEMERRMQEQQASRTRRQSALERMKAEGVSFDIGGFWNRLTGEDKEKTASPSHTEAVVEDSTGETEETKTAAAG